MGGSDASVGVGWDVDDEVEIALGVDVGPKETDVRVGFGVCEVLVCCAGLQPERRMARSTKPRMNIRHVGAGTERRCEEKYRTLGVRSLEALVKPFFMSHSLDHTNPRG